VKEEGDALVIRPTPGQLFLNSLAGPVAIAMTVVVFTGPEQPTLSPFWIVFFGIIGLSCGNALLVLRTMVRVTPNEVVVRNRLRTLRVPVHEVVAVDVVEKRWFLMPPVPVGGWFRDRNTGEVGVIRTSTGDIACDAIVGRVGEGSVARKKVAALRAFRKTFG
jgi:hypothetical protein